MSLVAIYILMILAIVTAIFALESKSLIVSVISLIVMNFLVWVVLLTYGALIIAWIQLIVYGGGFTALFIVVVALTEKQRDETFELWKTILAVIAVVVIVGLLIFAVTQSGITNIVGDVSDPSEIFTILWRDRTTDVILQGVIFFVTSVAIGTLFLQHNRKKTKEEIKA
ncbi:MAG: NADH-quinone oxidoreductase subunit J [Candidatus Heimdallarchaeota archaeon]|nr:NADH-quinone oxidoreductase subunit J [Candidatus Heimdallarchaeota archaeon]